MKRKKHSAEQIIKNLPESDAMLARGKTIGQACQHLEISQQTFLRQAGFKLVDQGAVLRKESS